MPDEFPFKSIRERHRAADALALEHELRLDDATRTRRAGADSVQSGGLRSDTDLPEERRRLPGEARRGKDDEDDDDEDFDDEDEEDEEDEEKDEEEILYDENE